VRSVWGILLVAVVAAWSSAPAEPATDAKKTLERLDDPVVMEGKAFPSLLGVSPKRLTIMARHKGEWEPVPFQIDEKKPDGAYCFTMGPQAAADPDPNLDGNDELVFMVKDTGDRLDGGQWPEGSLKGMEIEVTDPKDGGRGWLYLFSYREKAPRSQKDYIRLEIDREAGRRKVITYEYAMGGPTDAIYPDYLAQVKPDGTPGPDILDRLKMRGKVILATGIKLDYHMDEFTKARDLGWIDGPVRVLHLADGYLRIAGFIKLRGSGYSLISYYVNHMIWPMVIEVPFRTSLIRGIEFYGYMDFNSNVYGSYPFNAANPMDREVVLDGRTSEAEKKLDRSTPISWNAGFGPQGALVSRLFFRPKPVGIKELPFYRDDETASDPPEDNKGVCGVGYNLEGLYNNSAENSTVYQYYYYMSELKPEEVHRILDILDNPVKTRVYPMKAPD